MLRYVDLSDTNWDKRSMEYLVQALSGSAIRPLSGSPETSPNAAGHAGSVPDQEMPEKGSVSEDEDEKECDEDDSFGDKSSAYGSFVPPAPLLRDEDDRLPSTVQTLRMEGCSLRNAALELLGMSEPLLHRETTLTVRRSRHTIFRCQAYITTAESNRSLGRRGTRTHDPRLSGREHQHVSPRAILDTLSRTYGHRQWNGGP